MINTSKILYDLWSADAKYTKESGVVNCWKISGIREDDFLAALHEIPFKEMVGDLVAVMDQIHVATQECLNDHSPSLNDHVEMVGTEVEGSFLLEGDDCADVVDMKKKFMEVEDNQMVVESEADEANGGPLELNSNHENMDL